VYDINIQQDSVLKLSNSRGETWPHLDVVLVHRLALLGVKMITSDLLELYFPEETIEEDLKEHKEVTVLLSNFLHPLNVNLVGDFLKGALHLEDLVITPKSVDIVSEVNEEANLLF